MKKFYVVLTAALVIALVLWAALRIQQAHRQLAVAEFLPKTTLVLLEVPDLNRARQQWRGSDLNALWREPAVQAWLQRPVEQLIGKRRDKEMLEEFLQLAPTDGFVALTSIEKNEPKVVGGFHFEKSKEEARRFIEQREAIWLRKAGPARRATETYGEQKIETVEAGHFTLVNVFARDWFFISNDLATLKALLDRVERREQKVAESLRGNETFTSGAKDLPADYEAFFFVEPQPFVERLLPLFAMTGQAGAPSSLQSLKQVQSVAGTFGFDHGKMSESFFVAMPRQDVTQKLARPSLAEASTDTFLYSAALTRGLADWRLSPASGEAGFPFVRQLTDALVRQGISEEDCRLAFGEELEVIGEWPAVARWPSLLLALPVRDAGRARKITDALFSGEFAGVTWTRTEKNRVVYYNSSGFGGFVPVAPAVVLGERMLIAGTNAEAADAAINQKPPPAGALAKSTVFREAADRLPAADSAFTYLDTRLLFERADAALRPLLFLGATIYPALSKQLNASNLPPPETIAKHLSPIVRSQRYTGDGYLSQSVGPITFNEATIALVGTAGALYIYFQKGLNARDILSPTPSPTPSASPP